MNANDPKNLTDEQCCPICLEKGFREALHKVEGLIEIAHNPQAEKGAPRVVDCTGGCRYGLEPYFNPKSNGTFCFMLMRSERNPDAVVNHYWFHPTWIGSPL
ncbi:MAG: hypothetical protein ABIC40_00685 [bacterium]